MTSLIDTLEPQRHPVPTTEPTTPQRVIERHTQPSAGPPAPAPEPEHPSRPPGWVAALARHLRRQWEWDADAVAASTQAWEMMSRCSTTTRR
jgi:hypothetical protein